MDTAQIKKLAAFPLVEIGSHGYAYAHYRLSEIERAKAEQELSSFRAIPQQITDKEIDTITYPDDNYIEHIKEVAESIGYQYQLTLDYRCPADKSDSRILTAIVFLIPQPTPPICYH